MTPEEIVKLVEADMVEGGIAYQPDCWKTKLLLRIKALVEAERAAATRTKSQEVPPVK